MWGSVWFWDRLKPSFTAGGLEAGAVEASLKTGSAGANLKGKSDTRVGQKPGSTGTRSDPGFRVCQGPGPVGASLVTEWVKNLFLWFLALHWAWQHTWVCRGLLGAWGHRNHLGSRELASAGVN